MKTSYTLILEKQVSQLKTVELGEHPDMGL